MQLLMTHNRGTSKQYNTIQYNTYNIYFAIYDIYRWKKKMKKIDDRK